RAPGGQRQRVSIAHHAGGFVRRVDRVDLPAALADRTVLQVDQNHPQLPALVGGIARGSKHPDLLRADRRPLADALDRKAVEQTRRRIVAAVLAGLGHRGRTGGTAPPSCRIEKILTLTFGSLLSRPSRGA